MMVNLIDQDAAIAIAERYGCANGSSLGRHSGVADCIASELAKLPAVDAEPVRRGRWIGMEYDGYADGSPVYDVWACSECGEEREGDETTLTNYCPHCGAKMEVKDDDDK